MGTLPVSGLQIGMVAAANGFALKVSGFEELIVDLGATTEAQIQMGLSFPPNAPGIAAAVAVQLSPSTLASMLNPVTWASANLELQAGIVAEIAVLNGKISVASALAASLRAGFDAGGIVGWSYAGAAQRFGVEMSRELRGSTGGIPRSSSVSGLVIACEDAASWDSLSRGFNTGAARGSELRPMGSMTGGEVVTGLTQPLAEIDAYLEGLRGELSGLEANLQIALGADLMSPSELISLGASVDVDSAIGSLLELSVDIGAEVGNVNASMAALAEVEAELEASLSGGGLSLWRYSGAIDDLGASMEDGINAGLPGGGGPSAQVSGVVLACSSPSAWAAFGALVPT